jgi:nucleotide-binding universal stress UspA family protein
MGRTRAEGPGAPVDATLCAPVPAAHAENMDERRADGAAGLVMVGVDLASGSAVATDLAAWEAKRRHQPLLLVHGYLREMPYSTFGLDLHQPLAASARHDARSRLTDLEVRTRADHPGLAVRSTLVAGSAASTLVELSRTASLLVVGARGSGGFAGLTIGSVGAQVAMYAHASVLVVRPSETAEPLAAPVLVGLDGSRHGDALLAFGFDEAAARGVPLVALSAGRDADRILVNALDGWPEKYPEVPVRTVADSTDNPARRLMEATRHAGLVVVHSRGRGGFASLRLGSVSHALVAYAYCPVAVLRDEA